jgi:hypothetical protein
MLLIFIFTVTPAFSENGNGYKEKVDEIISGQVLPENLKDMPYLTYGSAKRALEESVELPQPTYIVKLETSIVMMKSGPSRSVTIYRVYFRRLEAKKIEEPIEEGRF